MLLPHGVTLSCSDAHQLVIAVAGGPDKRAAVLAAMRGRFANVLVTDADTAAGLLAVAQADSSNTPIRRNLA